MTVKRNLNDVGANGDTAAGSDVPGKSQREPRIDVSTGAPAMHRADLQSVAAEINARFDILSATRDRALNEGRQIVRLSANTVRALHRGEYEEASNLLRDARTLLAELIEHLGPYPSIRWAGYVQDAMKEFAEASVTLAVVTGGAIPTPVELGLDDAPYLNALAEAASELRREVLDRLRADQLQTAESLLAVMDEFYDVLITIDFPDAITGGLRRTTDQLRAVLERTRGDLTISLTQKRLERSLAAAREALGEANKTGAETIRAPFEASAGES
jgi:translin